MDLCVGFVAGQFRFMHQRLGEETPMEWGSDAHAAVILITLILPHYATRRRRSGANALSGPAGVFEQNVAFRVAGKMV